jgi:hypothetical protein
MSTRKNKAQWWQLYVMLAGLVVAFLLEMRLGLTGTTNIVAQLGILFLFYALIHAWMGANQTALMGLDEQDVDWHVKVYETPADQLRKRLGERPVLKLPQAGVKGVLGTTFEIDEFETKSAFSADEDLPYSEELFNKKDTTDAEV